MKDDPDPKPAKKLEVPYAPTEAEFTAFVQKLIAVPKAEVDRRHAQWAKKKKSGKG